jgi:hypothetical protein
MEAFEGTRDVMKSLGEKAKFLGKAVAKEAKKAVGLHVGRVTEANPRYYLVIAPQGAMVRSGIEMESPSVEALRTGDIVTCVDISGRRAKIIDPVEGWVSIRTESNDIILEQTIAPDKQTQVAQMEKRFEKLKAQQSSNNSDVVMSPTAATVHDTDAQSSSTMSSIKSKLTFKTYTKTVEAPQESNVPKLPAPGTRKLTLPKQSTPANDLLDLDSPKDVSPKQFAGSAPQMLPTAEEEDPFFEIMRSTNQSQNRPVQAQIPAPVSQEPKGSSNEFDNWFP